MTITKLTDEELEEIEQRYKPGERGQHSIGLDALRGVPRLLAELRELRGVNADLTEQIARMRCLDCDSPNLYIPIAETKP